MAKKERKEAVEILKSHPLYSQDWDSDYYKSMSKSFCMAVRALDILDSIKDEMSSVPIERGSGVFDCLRILDKYLDEV